MTSGRPLARDGDSQDPMASTPNAVKFLQTLYVLRSTRLPYVWRGFPLPTYSVPLLIQTVTYRATGDLARSSCSLVCKCSYIPTGASPSSQGWNAQLFNDLGLGSIVQNDFKQLGGDLVRGEGLVMTAGLPIGTGLNNQAADDLGLLEGTPVGSAVIDA